MIYPWYCKACDKDTEVYRSSANDWELPPEDGCETCGSKEVTRVIRPPTTKGIKGFVLEGTGWHDTDYSKTKSRL